MLALPVLDGNPSPHDAATRADPLPAALDAPHRHASPPWDYHHHDWLLLDALLADDHPARFVADFCSRLDYLPLCNSYAGRGSPPCPPQLLLRLVFFCFLHSRPSPEQWLTDSRESGPARWLLFGLLPARSTLYAFRDRIAPFLDGWHRQLLQTALAEGYTTGQRAALDGSYLRARASRHRLLTGSGLRRRCQLLQDALAEDQAALGQKRPLQPHTCWCLLVLVALLTTPTSAAGAEPVCTGELAKLLLPPRLRPRWMAGTPKGRQEQLRGLQRALRRWRTKDKRQQAKSPCRRKNKRGKGEKKVVVCVSEPEAALGRDKLKVFRPLYNVQILRDLDSEFILAFGTFTATSDGGLLPVLLERCERLTGQQPEVVVADHSYATALDLAYCDERDITLYTPLDPISTKPAKADKKYGKEAFRYDAERNVYVCPAGETLRPGRPRQESRVGGQTVQTVEYQARQGACLGCAQRSRCTQAKRGRVIKRSEHEGLLEACRQRLGSERGQRTYRLRKQTVELTIARLKRLLDEGEALTSYGKKRARLQVGVAALLLNALALWQACQRAGRQFTVGEDWD